MAAEKASDGGSGRSARSTLTTWKLPGRLCGRWADTAVCGRGAARGGLECTPARRPERKREREGTKRTLTGSSLGLQGPRQPTALVPGAEPGLGGQHTAGEAATVTHQTHTGTQHVRAEPIGHGGPGPLLCSGTREEGGTYCGRGRGGMSQGQGR